MARRTRADRQSHGAWRPRLSPGRALLAVSVGLLLVGAIGFAPLLPSSAGWLPPEPAAREYAQRALRTQRFTAEHLTHPIARLACDRVPFVAYSRSVGSELSDAWYNAAQIMADAATMKLGQGGRSCQLFKAASFMDVVAHPEGQGGFYPRANVDGTNRTTEDSYADDNAFIGLALLEARSATTDPERRAELLKRAESAAQYLMHGPLWDDTFGGGFWWNTNRGAAPEGKPGQTTALAAKLFARLYEETGQPAYAAWAQRSVDWLDARLYDSKSGLYRYGRRYYHPETQQQEYLDPRTFSYDQGIMIEVHLVFDRALASRSGHLERARGLAESVQGSFWEPELGGYLLSSDQPYVSAAYGAWLSQSLLALYEADPDPVWLERAHTNLDVLERWLLDAGDHGYSNLYFRCVNRELEGCEQGETWSYDPTKYLVSQAWMQRSQALLASALAHRE